MAYWRQGWKEAEQEGVTAPIHVRDVPACIRMTAVIAIRCGRFLQKSDSESVVGHERKRRVEGDSKIFGLSN